MTPSQIRPNVTYSLISATQDWAAGTEVRFAGIMAVAPGHPDITLFRRSDDYIIPVDPENLRLAFTPEPAGSGPTKFGYDGADPDECDECGCDGTCGQPTLGDMLTQLAGDMPHGTTVSISVAKLAAAAAAGHGHADDESDGSSHDSADDSADDDDAQ